MEMLARKRYKDGYEGDAGAGAGAGANGISMRRGGHHIGQPPVV